MSEPTTAAPASILDRGRDALNARMAKDDLRLVLENVIAHAADLEAERQKLVRWHFEDGKALDRLQRKVASLKGLLAKDDAEYAEAISERDRALETLAFQERTTLPELRRAVDHHRDGKQRWRERAEKAEARVRELERPAELKRRNEIRSTYSELISQAEQARDHEGAATLALQLRDSEAKWQREDEAVTS